MRKLVATLLGENVFHRCSIVGMINSIDELPKVRKYCKEHYNIEFEEFNQSRIDGFYSYGLIPEDNRDITLTLEWVDEL